jgi:hypothetical protein
MPIESGSYISELDSLWPLSGDFILEGDNHLRLLKSVLKAQFPGAGGQGFSQPIIANESEINYLQGLSSNVQDQLDSLESEYSANLYAPSGTVMVFYQASPPVGWSQIQNNNNSMLRVVDSNAGQSGGTDSPITFSVPAHAHTTQGHTLTIGEIPSHRHNKQLRSFNISIDDKPAYVDSTTGNRPNDTNRPSEYAGGGGSHSHGNTGSKSAVNFKPRYINVMTAVKD